MKKIKKKIFLKNSIQNVFFKILYLLLLFNPIQNECDKENPILKNSICILDYCSEDEFNNQTCS